MHQRTGSSARRCSVGSGNPCPRRLMSQAVARPREFSCPHASNRPRASRGPDQPTAVGQARRGRSPGLAQRRDHEACQPCRAGAATTCGRIGGGQRHPAGGRRQTEHCRPAMARRVPRASGTTAQIRGRVGPRAWRTSFASHSPCTRRSSTSTRRSRCRRWTLPRSVTSIRRSARRAGELLFSRQNRCRQAPARLLTHRNHDPATRRTPPRTGISHEVSSAPAAL